MLARIGKISDQLIGALNRRTTQVRQYESSTKKKSEYGRKIAINSPTGTSRSASPTFPSGIRQKMSAKMASVPAYGIARRQIGVAAFAPVAPASLDVPAALISDALARYP